MDSVVRDDRNHSFSNIRGPVALSQGRFLLNSLRLLVFGGGGGI